MAAEGPRDAFLKISKNSQKSQNSNFKILVHHFLHLCLLYWKKIPLHSNKIDVQRSKLRGIPNWGRNRAVKTNWLVFSVVCHYFFLLLVSCDTLSWLRIIFSAHTKDFVLYCAGM